MNAQAQPASWYESTQLENPRRPRLNYDLDVDVCVIGGGLAGLTTAREIARRGWSVALLEAGGIAGAASGRNTGFVLPGYAEDVDAMIERIGLDHTKELWALSQSGVDYVRRTIAETGVTAVGPVDGWLKVSKTDNWRELRNRVERLRWIGAKVEAWSAERVREQLRSRRYFGAMHVPDAFHVHPLNYAIQLARAAEAAGARIFEDTPAIALDAAGQRKRIQTPGARVRAPHVVLAANVQLGSLMPRLGATLMPCTSYVMETQPIGAALSETVRYHGAVSDSDGFDNHYRIVGSDRLQWSGSMTVWQADPSSFARSLAAGVNRVFPQLGEIQIAHVWSGTFGRTLHRMPQIGEIDRGVWVASGFGRHGLNTTALAGELVASGIVEKDQTWRLFAPYELVWAGGKLFRTVAQTRYIVSRPIANLREAVAQAREKARKRRETKAQARAALADRSKVEIGVSKPAGAMSEMPAKDAPNSRQRDATAAMLANPALLPAGDTPSEPNGKSTKRRKRTAATD